MQHKPSPTKHLWLTLAAMFWLGNCFAGWSPDTIAVVEQPAVIDTSVNNGIGAGINGGLQLSNVFYHTSLDTAYRSPLSYIISGQFNLSWKKITLPFSFILSEQERNFRQPFNQFGASPQYKWVTIHAGYRNITFSPYTLAGHTFLGGGVELNPGKLRFAAIYGRFTKAVHPDSVLILPGQSAYDRYALSVKLGVGKATNYFDVMYLKGWDNPNAIINVTDTSIARPASNSVLGFTLHQQMGKHFLLKLTTAASVFTNDINSSEVEATDKGVIKLIDAFNVNTSTQFHYAVDGSFGYTGDNFGIGAAYKRISPDYKSMGVYFVTNDVEQYTLIPSVNLWKRKIRLGGSVGFEHDNLAANRSFQTERVIGSANVSINPSPVFGITGNYYNYSIGQIQGIKQLNDTIRLAQVNRGITITPRITLGKKQLRHMVLFTYDTRNLDDKNVYTATYTEYQTSTQFINYAITHIDKGYTITLSANNNAIKSEVVNTSYRGGSVGVSKSFYKNTLNVSVNGGYNIIAQTIDGGGNMLNYNTNISYRFFKKHLVSLFGYSNIFNSATATIPSYTDYTFRLQYQYSFAKKSIL